MIIFHAIRWRNLLSTGNTFTEVILDKHPNTLIVGENGSGKSTLLEALCFVLFGKSFRGVNKPDMVNSINGKDLLVEVAFSIGSKKYRIRRGIKPNIFEVYVNGAIINQTASSKDYQDILEKTILKMNMKSFTQIVVLGSAAFTPFMQLSAADRRAVIEDLLDIQIFSNMNVIVKENLSSIKNELNEVRIKLQSTKEKIDLHKKHLEDLKKNNQEMIEAKRRDVANSQHQIVEFEMKSKELNGIIDKLLERVGDESVALEKMRKLVAYEAKIDNNKDKISKEVEFYNHNDTCPTCKQQISPVYKNTRVHECTEKLVEIDKGLSKLKEEQDAVQKRLKEIKTINEEMQSVSKDIANTNYSISVTRKYINNLNTEIESLSQNKAQTADSEEQSRQLVDEMAAHIERRKQLNEDKLYYDVAAQLLKDGGIKTRIIKQYLPIINKMVNKYLATMDFFVNFTIDEEFKECIKSRDRDNFSYQNFSQGEKQRIDLALLLTWRTIARMKNSVNTNLLILDETFDSSMDPKGTDALLEIIHAMEKTNVIVISHKDQLHDKFNNSLKFEKVGNFSRMVQV